MKKLMKLLPAMAVALGATAAFAFNSPNLEEGTLKGNLNGQWVEVSGNYQCALGDVCTARFDENDQMIPGSQLSGRYIPR